MPNSNPQSTAEVKCKNCGIEIDDEDVASCDLCGLEEVCEDCCNQHSCEPEAVDVEK